MEAEALELRAQQTQSVAQRTQVVVEAELQMEALLAQVVQVL